MDTNPIRRSVTAPEDFWERIMQHGRHHYGAGDYGDAVRSLCGAAMANPPVDKTDPPAQPLPTVRKRRKAG